MKRPRFLSSARRPSRAALAAGLALVAALALPGITLAGGVSVDPDRPLPDPVAGQPFTVGFTIHSLHDNQPAITDVKPIVVFSNPATGEQVHETAAAQGVPGHYAVTLTLKSPGDWRWQFQPYGTEVSDYLVTMPNLHVRKPGEAPAAAQAAPNPSKEVDAKVRDSYFEPHDITVMAGSTITWTNVGQIPHTVTADDGSFVSGNLKADQSFSFTFTRPGTYHYYCEYHGHKMQAMRGAVLPVGYGRSPAGGGGGEMEGTVTVVEAAQAAGSGSATAKPTPAILAQAAPEPAAPAALSGATTAGAASQSLPATGTAPAPLAAAGAAALAAVGLGALLRRRILRP